MTKPWRYWLTGGIAAVLATAAQAQWTPGLRDVRSRYSLEETADRIAEEARRHGLPVLARVAPSASLRRGAAPFCLVVLGTDATHTPVLQSSRGAALALPLTLRVAARDGGLSDVGFTDGRWLAGYEGLPLDVLDRVAALPALVEAALRA